MRHLRCIDNDSHLDQNWIHLMIAARRIGISKEEIREFLKQSSPDEDEPDS